MPQYRLYHSNRILCLSVEELIECGIVEITIKMGLSRHRQGKVQCWPHHKEGKRVYVHYDGIKLEYQARVRTMLCGGMDVKAWLLEQELKQKEACVASLNDSLPSRLVLRLEDLEWLKARGLNVAHAHQSARAAAWLRLLNDTTVKGARTLGYQRMIEFQSAVFNYCSTEQSEGLIKFRKVVTNERVLDRLAREFKKEGLDVLISGQRGNCNRGLIGVNPMTHAKLMALAGNPVKYSFEDVGMLYNDFAQAQGLAMLTVSAIKQHLNKPVYKKEWEYLRHGKLVGDKKHQAQVVRREVPEPDMLWSMDGTTMQLYYRDAEGKIKSDLYIGVVADVHSGAIIGYSIGVVENESLVTQSLQNAVSFRNYLPYQLQYDNGSANIAGAVQALMGNMTEVHFPCEPYNAKGKYAEAILGHFQQRILRKLEHFKGGNITAKSDNSKANPELLKKFKDNPAMLPDMAGVIADFEAAIADWNNRGLERDSYGRFKGITKLERYEKVSEKRRKVSDIELVSLFMAEQNAAYKYTTQGIKITIGGKKHHFIVPDVEGDYMNHHIFLRNHLDERFVVKINKENPILCTLYQGDKYIATARSMEYMAACVADMRPGEGKKIKDFLAYRKADGYELAKANITAYQAMVSDAEDLLKPTGTDGISHVSLNSKEQTNIEESFFEDVLNNMNVETDLEKALKRMAGR